MSLKRGLKNPSCSRDATSRRSFSPSCSTETNPAPDRRLARRGRLTGRTGCAAFVGALLALFGLVGPAYAITTAFGIPPLFQNSLVADDAWKGVGLLTIGGSTCTGTMITTQQVLTAAHCFFPGANGIGQQVGLDQVMFQLVGEFNDEQFAVTSIKIPTDYDSTLGHIPPRNDNAGQPKGAGDIAVLTLAKELKGATTYAWNTGQIPDERKPTLTTVKVGYGNAGNGTDGAVSNTSGTKRQMVNTVDEFGDGKTAYNDCTRCPITPPAKTLLYDFDDPTAPRKNATSLKNAFLALDESVAVDVVDVMGREAEEGSAASGDSGGPLFQFVGGTPIIVGITSSGSDRPQNLFDTKSSRFGNLGFDTRVLAYKEFIAQAIVPAPSSLALLTLGAGLLLSVARIARRGDPA